MEEIVLSPMLSVLWVDIAGFDWIKYKRHGIFYGAKRFEWKGRALPPSFA